MWLQAAFKSTWTRHIGAIVLLTLVFTFLFSGTEWQTYRWQVSLLVTFFITAALWLGHGFLAGYISSRISWTRQPVLRLTVGVFAVVAYTVFINILVLELLEWYLHWEMSSSNYFRNILITTAVATLISLILHAATFLTNWRQAAVDKERLEKAHVASQYESLRNQVSPHFLFNSLNVLAELVHQDAREAERFIQQLGLVYRYVLEKRELEVVPLQEELDFLKSFLFLHEIRQPNTLQLSWPQQLDESPAVPPLALQLLVENALKHNVMDESRPLKLVLELQDNFLVVENVLQRRAVPSSGTGLGLANLVNRYQYLSDTAVEITETPDYFRVRLPLLKLPQP